MRVCMSDPGFGKLKCIDHLDPALLVQMLTPSVMWMHK